MAGKKFRGMSESLSFTVTGSPIANGTETVIGITVGVVQTEKATAAVGELATFHKRGLFEGTALSTDVWAFGDQLYWDQGNTRWTDQQAAGLYAAGKAAAPKANGETTALVDIDNAHTAVEV